MPGPLSGLSVVEFGEYIAAPLLGMLLADQGADVVKVERPGGDPARRDPAWEIWNRGKQSVVADVASASGRQVVSRLLARADLVIENLAPGATEQLAIDYEAVRSVNPEVIYCSMPGYGAWSLDRGRRGWDPVIAAETAVFGARLGEVNSLGEPDPLYTALPLPSTVAALVGAVAVAAALIARRRHGVGQFIEVPLHDAMFHVMGVSVLRVDGNRLPFGPRLPIMRQYQCADGRWIQSQGNFERFVEIFLTVAGHPEWIAEATAILRRAPSQEVEELWAERFQTIYRTRSSWEWEDAINAADGCCAVCRTIEEWLESDHARQAGIVVEVDGTPYGRMKQPGLAVNLSASPGSIRRAPLLGEHNDRVNNQAVAVDKSALAINGQRRTDGSARQALDGFRVLDLAIVLAGPAAGEVLGQFGADVIKVDDPRRPAELITALEVNRAKRSIVIDLKTESGRAVLKRMAGDADVFIENYRDGKLEQLGFGFDQLAEINPRLVYASMNAFGYGGEWSRRAGWEQIAEAATGIEVRHGGAARPVTLPYPVNDYGTGLVGAFGVMLALYGRLATGKGQRVQTGLAVISSVIQSRFHLDFDGYRRAEPHGPRLLGESASSRLYHAKDGWIYLHLEDEQAWRELVSLSAFDSLRRSTPFAEVASAPCEGECATAISGVLAKQPAAFWIDALRDTSVGVGRLRSIADIERDPLIRGAGLIVKRDHPGIGMVDHVGVGVRLSSTPMQIGRPTPVFGADTEAVLAGAGYTNGEIAALRNEGVVALGKFV